ncbi:TetR/AcrR family transcriptional regulator [Gilvimarinus agarilyticus]|uniref:TetR/AcrR family transcriptional regulator n=1 Tax=Gilvimarinus agarilyticus TaxID=679259 RepID=UPI00059F6F8B|nr:TetR/AcrR family transcriptional regulator [Gilvimarinus agarilyticus]
MTDKRQLLIDTALELFYRRGVNSVGINEVLSASGVAKKTLYHHFSSKNALLLAVLEQRHRVFIGWLAQQLEGAGSNDEVIERLFNGLSAWFEGRVPQLGDYRGCFFVNTCAELSDTDSEVSRYCQYHKWQVRQLIAGALTGESDTLLDAVCLLKEGAISTAYVAQEKCIAERCVQVLRGF